MQVLESGSKDASLAGEMSEMAYTLAMHSAAMKPSFLSKGLVPEDMLAEAREEAKAQLENQEGLTTDPAKLAKIVEGKQAKAVQLLYKRDVLLE